MAEISKFAGEVIYTSGTYSTASRALTDDGKYWNANSNELLISTFDFSELANIPNLKITGYKFSYYGSANMSDSKITINFCYGGFIDKKSTRTDIGTPVTVIEGKQATNYREFTYTGEENDNIAQWLDSHHSIVFNNNRNNGNVLGIFIDFNSIMRVFWIKLTLIYEQVINRTISTSVSPSNTGTATGSGIYQNGTSVTLTATPASGYRFVNWTKNGTQVSTNATYTFTASEDATYTANFALNTCTITATISPAGAGTVAGTSTYTYGSSVTLTATPNPGYVFYAYDGGTFTNPLTFTATSDHNFTVTFKKRPFSGTNTIKKVFVGTTPVKAIYIGTTKVYDFE